MLQSQRQNYLSHFLLHFCVSGKSSWMAKVSPFSTQLQEKNMSHLYIRKWRFEKNTKQKEAHWSPVRGTKRDRWTDLPIDTPWCMEILPSILPFWILLLERFSIGSHSTWQHPRLPQRCCHTRDGKLYIKIELMFHNINFKEICQFSSVFCSVNKRLKRQTSFVSYGIL